MQPAKVLLKRSVEIFGKYFWQMLLVSLVPYIFGLIIILVVGKQNNPIIIISATILVAFFYFIGQFALAHAAVQVTEGRFSLLQAYRSSLKKVFSLIWINYINISAIFIVMTLAVAVLGAGRLLGNLVGTSEFRNVFLGVLFLLIALAIVVVGLIISLRLSLASWFLITDRYRGIQASVESLKATAGNVWILAKKVMYLVLWYIIIFVPISILSAMMPKGFGDFLTSIFSVIFVPVSVLYIYQVFVDITSNSGIVGNEVAYAKWLKRSVYIATLLIIVSIILAILFRDQIYEFMVLNQMLRPQ